MHLARALVGTPILLSRLAPHRNLPRGGPGSLGGTGQGWPRGILHPGLGKSRSKREREVSLHSLGGVGWGGGNQVGDDIPISLPCPRVEGGRGGADDTVQSFLSGTSSSDCAEFANKG